MSQARILSKMGITKPKEEKLKKGDDYLKQALILLSCIQMMDNLLKQHPSLIKSLSLDLSIPSKKSQQDILIDHSEWLLTESAECGNKVADLVLQALNEQKTPKKNTNPTKYLNFLGDDNEEQSLLIDDIRISENYFKY